MSRVSEHYREQWWGQRELARLGLEALGKRRLAAVLLGQLSYAPLSVGQTLLTGLLVGTAAAAAGTGTGSAASKLLLLAVLLQLVQYVARQALTVVNARMRARSTEQINLHVRGVVRALSLRPATVAHLERPEWRDRTSSLLDVLGPYLGWAVLALGSRISAGASRLGELLVVMHFSPALGVGAYLVGTLLGAATTRIWSPVAQTNADAVPQMRRFMYLRGLLASPSQARESRVFDNATWLEDRAYEEFLPWFDVRERARRAARGKQLLLLATWGSCLVLLAVPILTSIADGATSIGAGTAYFWALMSVSMGYGGSDQAYFVQPLRELRRMQAELRGFDLPPKPPAPALEKALETRALHFTYDDGPAVLQGLDLVLRPGESVAIVGANGAGKTTLVKLLLGLYEPTSGAVLVDGVDLAQVDVDSWRAQTSALFQDFLRLPLTARDNVALGCPALADDQEALERAAAAVRADEVVRGLPHGWDTVLNRQLDGGVDLSGGQWQRLALARALFAVRGGARLLVLDEPTASLDVRLEAELFERMLDLTRGRTTVLVSHRFSTVRKAQRIIVLEHGRVLEDGSHQELMALGGRYAEMFTLQASHFDEAPDLVEEAS